MLLKSCPNHGRLSAQQIEETRDPRREWINMVTNRRFKREFTAH